MKITHAIFLLMIGLVLAIPMSAQEINFETKNWDKLKQKAAKKDKILFVDAYTTWCGPCKWMSANVFTDPAVAEFFNKEFINVKLDMENGEGLDFAKEYEVNAYPTLLFIDGNGDVVHKKLGAAPAEDFLEVGKTALDPNERLGRYMAEYNKGNRDPEFLQQYVTKMVSAGMNPKEAADMYFSSLSAEEAATEDNFMLMRMMYPPPAIDDEAFKVAVENRDAFAAVVGEKEIDGFLKETCQNDIVRALYRDDAAAYQAAMASIESMDMPFTEEVLLYGKMRNAWGAGDYPAYIGYADQYSESYTWDDWSTLNSMAWDIYEDTGNASEDYVGLGIKMAKRSVELNENPYNTDTYAALLYKRGEYTEALTWAEKAVDLAEQSEMDPSETRKLIDKINSSLKTN